MEAYILFSIEYLVTKYHDHYYLVLYIEGGECERGREVGSVKWFLFASLFNSTSNSFPFTPLV